MNLQTPLSGVTGIGSTFATRLQKLDLYTVGDLINHYPFRYDDFSKVSKVSQLTTEEIVTLRGQIWKIDNAYTKFKKVITKAVLNDGTGSVDLVWFNQPWLTKNLAVSDYIQVSGKIERFTTRSGVKISLTAPEWEKVPSHQENFIGKHTGRLVPVYPETYGVSSKWIRTKIYDLLPQMVPLLEDPLPENIRNGMVQLNKAVEYIHYPESHSQMQMALNRLAFDELFYIQLATLQKRELWREKPSTRGWRREQKLIDKFITQLPFELTGAQTRVIQEIVQDVQQSYPMNRLVQGDVGSGKTIVAAVIAYLAYLNGFKTLFMAPTEILAFQHHRTLSTLLQAYDIKVGIYTGSRKEMADHIIVGTHALLSEKFTAENVGLVIVDEQQRFGVAQRTTLRNKGETPHFLTMTATPIPRTVALTLYGDLDLSIIDEMPKGRKIVRTHLVPPTKRKDAYAFIEKYVQEGRQVYIVTPLIEESETNESAKAAKVEYERLSKEIFPHLRVGLLHGKLSSKDKEAVISAFKNHEIDILISTSVVEVGVDVPNATIMMIEGAERFGLAQLHQLRGRVGRGSEQSFCFLFAQDEAPEVVSKLKNLETIFDGLKLAELDLKIRGSGDIFGHRQSGRWNLRLASLSDLSLIEKTRSAAQEILADSLNLDKYPGIKAKLEAVSAEVFPD